MKKLMAILVLALVFAGLTPLALAERGNGSEGAEGNGDAGRDEAMPAPVLYGAGVQSDSPVMARINASLGLTEGQMEKARELAQERIKEAQEKFAQAKEKYAEARERYGNAQAKIENARARYKECSGNEDAECKEVRKEVKQGAKDLLSNSADRIISSMQKLRERIAESEDLSEEDAAAQIAEIDARIAEIQAAKETAGGLTNESSPAEISAAVKEIRDAWQGSKDVVKANAAGLVNAKIGGIAVKSQHLGERLEIAVGKLSDNGVDTSEMEALVGQFKAKIESAKQNQETAQSMYRGAASGGENNMQEANRHMQAAHKDLKDAHALLVQLLKQMKSAKGGAEAIEEANTEDAGSSAEESA